MEASDTWRKLPWRHELWDLVRYYCSLRGSQQKDEFLSQLTNSGRMSTADNEDFMIDQTTISLFSKYLDARDTELSNAYAKLRCEKQALDFCKNNNIDVGTTRTKNVEHHQSSKALVATVSHIASEVCESLELSIDANPQRRCVWCNERGLHVTARNLDGAIPGLANPAVIWEIKEYWGKTSGGSKMSDAVYECNLVGHELREFEERSGIKVKHVVFVDGQEQWAVRKSDLARFLDLMNQGVIDYLFVGVEVETAWKPALQNMLE